MHARADMPPARSLAAMTETELYDQQGFLALPALFPVAVLDAFHRQLRADLGFAEGHVVRYMAPDKLLRGVTVNIHAAEYAPLTTFHWGLTPRMAQLIGRDLLPSFAFFRIYQRDEICRVHADRVECEHSLSLTVAAEGEAPWSLSLATTDGPDSKVREDFDDRPFASVPMRPGDAVAYRGIDRRHGRIEPNPNAWSAHLFLHWVDADGRYRDRAFDRVRQPTVPV
ncbi:hypothetical protein [Sphingomonas immobilis]|uniref:Fe2OG dioxygenase domain-containing protein n=1 Tax=Sphingomonas immobilis TaxID=3063997 RepID=A0ABT8ZYV7_9SPHN|nr:hypothetical protein [Sphingomonas sp. CA1-15]MDO7842754.1 hypothetical protein [Sphingomonas sp. CA1-15]